MKVRSILLSFILFISIRLVAEQQDNLFQNSEFYYSIDSFIGSDYFPQREEKIFTYFENHFLKIGWIINPSKHLQIWAELSYSEDLLDKKVNLERTGVSYKKNNLELKYKFDEIGFGKLSKIFNTNVNDVYFDAPVLGEYDFVGLEFSVCFKEFKFISEIGGNNFNASIIDVVLKRSSRKGEYTFFYLFAGRDNNFNINIHSIGLDLYHDFCVFSLYESITYQYLPSGTRNPRRENLVSLTELIVQPVKSFEFGTNYLFSRYDWNQLKIWQSQSFMNYDHKEISIYFSYLYKNWENFFNRTINQILFFHVIPQFKIGLNSSYFIPSEGDDYYQIGFQVNFHEENN